MSRRDWKKVRATSLRHAMELCLEHARVVKRLKAEQVAELMGLPNHWNLYKWLENGRLPTNLIRPFENACGIDFVTQYLGQSSHRLLIDIPRGRTASNGDMAELQLLLAEVTQSLVRFYAQTQELDETITSINNSMTALAWHRQNALLMAEPELELFSSEEDA